jgi:hypothetical protein
MANHSSCISTVFYRFKTVHTAFAALQLGLELLFRIEVVAFFKR